MKLRHLLFIIPFIVLSCKSDKKSAPEGTEEVKKNLFIPDFSQDSAYAHIEKQLSFGHRVPGTAAHTACRDWLVSKLNSNGVSTQLQEFKVSFLGQKNVPAFNIIGTINPDARKRILIAAHYDSRLIAEKDKDETLKDKPIMGADDGASGVAVILELTRIFKEYPLEMGVDIVFFDAEDQGKDGEGWCEGAKYWSKNPHRPGYGAKYGILLDMVGAKGASFKYEGNAYNFDPALHEAIWTLAGDLGYSNFFIPRVGGAIEDDHFYVMQNMGIPMVDIINTKNDGSGGFADYHHTHKDDIGIIDKRTLQVVGKVMNNVIYRENE
jgi:hypothetical protein